MDTNTYAILIAVSPILTLIAILMVIFLFVLAQKFIRARRRRARGVDATTTNHIMRDGQNK